MTTPIRAGQIIRAKRLNARINPGTELIEEVNLATTDFGNIPQDFRHLELVLWGGLAADGGTFADVGLRVNNDSGANYNGWRWAQRSDDTPDNQFDSGLGSMHVATWGGVTTRNTARLLIGNYTANVWHNVQSEFTGVRSGGDTAGNHIAGQVFAYRFVNEPVTSLGFFVIGGANEFADPTIASLYGLR